MKETFNTIVNWWYPHNVSLYEWNGCTVCIAATLAAYLTCVVISAIEGNLEYKNMDAIIVSVLKITYSLILFSMIGAFVWLVMPILLASITVMAIAVIIALLITMGEKYSVFKKD